MAETVADVHVRQRISNALKAANALGLLVHDLTRDALLVNDAAPSDAGRTTATGLMELLAVADVLEAGLRALANDADGVLRAASMRQAEHPSATCAAGKHLPSEGPLRVCVSCNLWPLVEAHHVA